MNGKKVNKPRFLKQNSVLMNILPIEKKLDEDRLNKQRQRQYKEDLDYLCSLKNRNKGKDNYFKQKQEDLQSIENKYFRDQQYQHSLLKQFSDNNIQEARNKRMKALESKRRETSEEAIALYEVQLQESIEKEKQQKRKCDIQRQLQLSLKQYNTRKAQLNEHLLKEKEKELQQSQKDDVYVNNEKLYKAKIEGYNCKIYTRVRNHNEYINNHNQNKSNLSYPLIKSDGDLNKIIAEQKAIEKELLGSKKSPVLLREEIRFVKEEEDLLRERILRNQRSYKQILDNQTQFKQLERKDISNEGKSEALLMPGYHYSIYPSPLLNKAFAPLKKDLFISHDFSNRDLYLGKSVLKRNPLIFPIDDIGFNQYVIKDLQRLNNYSRSPFKYHFNTHNK